MATQFDTSLQGGISRPDNNLIFPTTSPLVQADLSNGFNQQISAGQYHTDAFQTTLNPGKTQTDIVDPTDGNNNSDGGSAPSGADNDPNVPTPPPDPIDPSVILEGLTLDPSKLQSQLDSVWQGLFSDNIRDTGLWIKDILNTLQNAFTKMSGVNDDEATQLAVNAYNAVSGYLTSIYDKMYARQNWLLENDYNSPKNQMARLMDAGINPAFYYGCLGASNGGQISNSEMTAPTGSYTPQSQAPDWLQNVATGVGAAAELATAAVGVVSLPSSIKNITSQTALNFAEADRIKKLVPFEKMNYFFGAASSLSNALVNSQTEEGLRLQNDITRSSLPALKQMPDAQLKNVEADTKNKQSQVDLNGALQYKAVADVNIAVDSLLLNYEQMIRNYDISLKQIRLEYDRMNSESFQNFVRDLAPVLEQEKYFATDIKTGETREIGLNALPSIVGSKLQNQNSYSDGTIRYERHKVTSKVLDGENMSKLIGGVLRWRQDLFDGKTKFDPLYTNMTLGIFSNIWGHATEMADKNDIDNFARYSIRHATGSLRSHNSPAGGGGSVKSW